MIIYRYSTSASVKQVYEALTSNNNIRVKLGLNLGYTSGDNGNWLHDHGWRTFQDTKKQYPEPHMEYMIERKNNLTIIQLAFYYDVLIKDIDTTISRSEWRRELFEKTLKTMLKDFKSYPEVIN